MSELKSYKLTATAEGPADTDAIDCDCGPRTVVCKYVNRFTDELRRDGDDGFYDFDVTITDIYGEFNTYHISAWATDFEIEEAEYEYV
jgi:hypothetical protein